MRLRGWVLAAAGIALFLRLVAPAAAITYGQADGGRHPNVCGVVTSVQYGGAAYPFCSGTLIAPDIVLTAAHCGSPLRMYVTFDEAPGENSVACSGTFFADPEYDPDHTRWDDPHDIAVIVLDQPIDWIDPATLPTRGALDALSKDQKLTAVGYGGQESVHVPGEGAPTRAFEYDRECAVESLDAVNPAWLRLSQNPATGDGGGCYGDSGGPNFLGADDQETSIIAGTTISGDAQCRALNVIYRLDTDSARDFLSQFVEVP